MSTQRKPSQRRTTSSREARNEEPVSITKPMPGSTSYSEESKAYVERLGDVLKRLREQRGDDLQYISDYLCIKRGFLEALESSHYDELPADAYVIGFLRSYANYLGIDGKEAIDRYRSEMAGRRKKPELVLPTPISEGRTPSAIIMAGAALAALLIYVLWYGLSSSDRTSVTTPPALPSTPVPENTQSSANGNSPTPLVTPAPTDAGIVLSSAPPAIQDQTAVQNTAQQPDTQTPAKDQSSKQSAAQPAAAATDAQPTPAAQATAQAPAAPAAGSTRIAIRATQSSWVLILDKAGHAVYDHVMKPGEVYNVPDKPGLNLTTGNGAGITVTLDGADMPRLATGTSHVVRNLPLTSDYLRNLPPSPEE